MDGCGRRRGRGQRHGERGQPCDIGEGCVGGQRFHLCQVRRHIRVIGRDRAKARRRPFTIAGTYAKRFAAKEAYSKAVGTGFRRGVFMKDIGVVNAPSGAPTLALEGGAAKRLEELTPAGHEARIHLTLTDDHPWAQAFVIIEANPKA